MMVYRLRFHYAPSRPPSTVRRAGLRFSLAWLTLQIFRSAHGHSLWEARTLAAISTLQSAAPPRDSLPDRWENRVRKCRRLIAGIGAAVDYSRRARPPPTMPPQPNRRSAFARRLSHHASTRNIFAHHAWSRACYRFQSYAFFRHQRSKSLPRALLNPFDSHRRSSPRGNRRSFSRRPRHLPPGMEITIALNLTERLGVEKSGGSPPASASCITTPRKK